MAVAASAAGGQAAVDFRTAAARNRVSSVYTIPWVTGSRPQTQLHNDGYLSALAFWFSLTVTVNTTGTVTDAAAANSNFLPFIGIKNPDGAYIWSTNSRDLYDWCYRLYYGVNPSGMNGYAMWAPGTGGAQAVNMLMKVPVGMNDGFNFDVGLIMRQLSNVFFILETQMANFSDLIGAGTVTLTSIAGQLFVNEEVYDAVDPNSSPKVDPPSFSEYVQLRSLQSQALQNGSNDLTYATGPVLTDIFLRIINNGAADGTITNLTFVDVKINQRQVIDHRAGQVIAEDNRLTIGENLRAGVYHEDFFDDRSVLNTTSGRDFINSNRASQLDFFVQYAGTPSGTSFVGQFFRELVAAA